MNIASIIEVKANPKIPELAPGDSVKVSVRIVEAGKERIQVYQGVVIRIRRGGIGSSFTVRHVAYGVGVERTFPLYSPMVQKVEIVRHGKVRRANLYYLRGLSGKAARKKVKRIELTAKKAEGLEEGVAESVEAIATPESAVAPEPAAAPEQPTAQVPAASEPAAAPESTAEPTKAESPEKTES